MKAAKRKKKKSIFLRIALAAFSVYVVVMLVQLQFEISERQKHLSQQKDAITRQTIENEDLQKQIDDYQRYLEKKAREQGLARPGETIYIEVPGN